ncbi:MAG: hypothetical protein ABI616_10655 [Pseudomonadota bacterium]
MKGIADIRIPANHPAFAGHFPDAPIVPGVVLLDEALRAITLLTGVSFDNCVLSSVKFKRFVLPGEALTLRYEFPNLQKLRFDIDSTGTLIATGLVTLRVPDAP